MSPQFYRLVWKEYRTQRSLWLVLMFCIFLLQALFCWVSTMENNSEFIVAQIVGTVFLIASCFTVASMALLFAGEEDLGTAVWLRQVPVSTRCLFWAKTLTSMTGTVAMILVGAASAAIMIAARQLPVGAELEDPQLLLLVPVLMFVISLFWSLLCRSVFKTMGCVGATIVFIAISQQIDVCRHPVTRCSVVAIMAALTIPLIRRWHRGPRSHAAGVRRIGLPATSKSPKKTMFSGSLSRRFVVWVGLPFLSVLLITAIVFAAFQYSVLQKLFVLLAAALTCGIVCLIVWAVCRPSWKKWLIRAASGPSQLTRTSSVLIWQECRRVIPLAAIVIACGIAAVVVRVEFTFGAPWPCLLLCVVVEEFGLRTFRHDQQKLHGLFWSHRGVSPLLVWGIRTSVWLGALLVVAATLFVMDLAQVPTESRGEFAANESIAEILDRSLQLQNDDGALGSNPEWPRQTSVQLLFCFVWLVGGFVIGQLCSCWIRKPLIAFFVAACGFVFYNVILLFCVYKDVPLILSAGPIILVATLGMLRSRTEWMDRRFSFGIGFRRAAYILIPLLCLWPASAAWRMFQVAESGHAFGVVPTNVGYTEKNQSSNWAKDWNQLSGAAEPLRSVEHILRNDQQLSDQRLQSAMEAVDSIRKNLSYSRLPPDLRHPWSHFPAKPAALAIILKAHQLREQGQADQALSQLVVCVELIRFLQTESSSWEQWFDCLAVEQQLLQHIHWVATDDGVTQQQLRLVASTVYGAKRKPESVSTMLRNREAVYSQLLNRSGYLWDRYEQDELTGLHELPESLLESGFSERKRFLSLMQISNGVTLHQKPVAPGSDILRWAATTETINTDLLDDPVFQRNQIAPGETFDGIFTWHDFALQQLDAARRATWVILQMQSYRRDHSELPVDLRTLRTDAATKAFARRDKVVLDDFQMLSFRYQKGGLGYQSFTRQSTFLSTLVGADQPVLMSQYASPHTRQTEDPYASRKLIGFRALKTDANRIVYLDGSHAVPPAGEIQEWRQNEDTKILEPLSEPTDKFAN